MSSVLTSKKTIAAIVAILVLLVFIPGCGKEHPEHPEKQDAEITKDDIADAIEGYVDQQSDEKNGIFIVVDDVTGEKLELVLDKVHRDKLAKVGENTYFACADFTTSDGVVYDLDVFMTGPDADNMVFDEFSVHKVDGKERYTWNEESDGIWVKEPIEE